MFLAVVDYMFCNINLMSGMLGFLVLQMIRIDNEFSGPIRKLAFVKVMGYSVR